MTTKLQAAAIEFNTLHDHAAPVGELQSMARFETGDDRYCTPVSGDTLAKINKLGLLWAEILVVKQWESKP